MDVQAQQIERVRRFSRFYTKQIGLLDEVLLRSRFTLPEGRVVFELAQQDAASPGEIAEALGLDPGYLSRIVAALEGQGIVRRERSPEDGRRVVLTLTEEGRDEYGALSAASRSQIGSLLAPLPAADRERVVEAMQTVERLLGQAPEPAGPVVLRGHRSGDIGWVVQRHGELYHELRGWDVTFDALVADIAARFVTNFDAEKERCWIAERDGVRIGSVFLTRHDDATGQLRMLIVEPWARGLGVGRRLVGECVTHARFVGYERMILYTSKGLDSARRLYEAEGFRLVEETPREVWGKQHIEQWWELTL